MRLLLTLLIQLILQITNAEWTHQLGGDIDGQAAGDYFGKSVSLSSDGSIVAIGGYGNDDNGAWSGHVRVYKRDANDPLGWVKLGEDIDGEAAEDYSGWSVSISSDGSIVAIGANYNDGNGTWSGHVRVYKLGSCTSSMEPSDYINEQCCDC